MEDIQQVYIKYHNFMVYRSSLKEQVPINTRNTTSNTFSVSFFVVPHLSMVLKEIDRLADVEVDTSSL